LPPTPPLPSPPGPSPPLTDLVSWDGHHCSTCVLMSKTNAIPFFPTFAQAADTEPPSLTLNSPFQDTEDIPDPLDTSRSAPTFITTIRVTGPSTWSDLGTKAVDNVDSEEELQVTSASKGVSYTSSEFLLMKMLKIARHCRTTCRVLLLCSYLSFCDSFLVLLQLFYREVNSLFASLAR